MLTRLLARLLALPATALLTVGIGLVVATPALAADGGICSPNSFCLYQWKAHGAQVNGNRWQTSLYNIYEHPEHCLKISPAAWANGTPVNDNSASLMWSAESDLWAGRQIFVYNWSNCDNSGGFAFWRTDTRVISIPDLSTRSFHNGMTMYHTISSVRIV